MSVLYGKEHTATFVDYTDSHPTPNSEITSWSRHVRLRRVSPRWGTRCSLQGGGQLATPDCRNLASLLVVEAEGLRPKDPNRNPYRLFFKRRVAASCVLYFRLWQTRQGHHGDTKRSACDGNLGVSQTAATANSQLKFRPPAIVLYHHHPYIQGTRCFRRRLKHVLRIMLLHRCGGSNSTPRISG